MTEDELRMLANRVDGYYRDAAHHGSGWALARQVLEQALRTATSCGLHPPTSLPPVGDTPVCRWCEQGDVAQNVDGIRYHLGGVAICRGPDSR